MSDYSNNKLEKYDYYLTPEGYRVFTEKYLLKRGYCCQNGCRHCPYGFDKTRSSKSKVGSRKKDD